MGPSERYVRAFALQRQESGRAWTEMEQALVATLIDWSVECSMRSSAGPGSDCSDLMDAALARIQGLATGDLTPDDVLNAYAEAEADHTPSRPKRPSVTP